MTIATFVFWALSVTPLARHVVSPDKGPEIQGVLTALLGLGPALKVFSRR